MTTTADSLQEEFFNSNGKLYVNFNQEQFTDEEGTVMYKMETLKVDDKRKAPSIIKQWKLDNIIVTLDDNETRFYANSQSRSDISDAISLAEDMGATAESTTTWKTPDGFKTVTLAQLKQAKRLGLEAKASIIGVI